MTVTTPALSLLKLQVETFRKTNNFTPGDPGSFSIPILKGVIELPGKHEPGNYLTSINAKDLAGKNVVVMFAGNGGLCVEALNQGAIDVWAVEPRNNYAEALKTISGYIAQVKGRAFSSVTNFNEFENFNGKFDYVIWSEGLEQLKNPLVVLGAAWKLLAPGGKFIIEVTHGEHVAPMGAINRWTPKEEIFAALLQKLVENAPIKVTKGRLQRRTIYEVTRPVPTIPTEEKQAAIETFHQEVVPALIAAGEEIRQEAQKDPEADIKKSQKKKKK